MSYVSLRKLVFIFALPALVFSAFAEAKLTDPLEQYNVTWETPSKSATDSMPTGNGDIGLNVWVEENGNLIFYISKTDSWSENGRLLKLGRVRIKLSPNPFAKGFPFQQELKLRQSEIVITAGEKGSEVTIRLWVDANDPVIRVEATGEKKFEMEVNFETWRQTGYTLKTTTISDMYNALRGEKTRYPTIVYPDVIVPGEQDRVVWYHHNVKSAWPVTMKLQGLESVMDTMSDPLLGRTFGGAIKGDGLISTSERTLKSVEPRKAHSISIYVVARHPTTVAGWLNELNKTIDRVEKINIEKTRKAHHQWWDNFWNRSWIRISGDGGGVIASKGYTLQRYMHACGGRGAQPIKFNGSIFTTPHEGDPDYRQWGPGFWWQNQRLVYWSLMGSGDFDLLQPFFNMYVNALPLAEACNRIYYQHEGAHFPETIYFWGSCTNDHYGWDRKDMPVWEVACKYVAMEWQGGLELLAIMLDYYAYTQDDKFLNEMLLPMACEIITFYDLHYKRDENGKLYIWPAQALETWWDCSNPMPEVAGLKFVLGKLLELPENQAHQSRRDQWKRLTQELPALPTRKVEGKTVLAAADSFANKNNIENPELYAVFPYRLYGVGKSRLEMGRLTFEHRLHQEGNKGHDQDDIHAAYLGLAEVAAKFVTRRYGSEYLTARFPTFWYGYDWIPDHCHGGVGLIALQAMLMQCENEKILLFPAWPKDWDVEFKLHAPYKTTVEGIYHSGKLASLKVMPESRKKDVVLMAPE